MLHDLTELVAVAGPFIVIIVWIVMRYDAKRRVERFSADEQAALETLTRVAERLEERVATLEQILDVEQPRWRQSYKDTGR